MKNDTNKSYVINCLLSPKNGDTIFSIEGDDIFPHLDGYAIIPMQEYERLIQSEIGTKKT